MNLIQEQQWGEVSIHTWGDLSPHWWMCFRYALVDTISEMAVKGARVDDTGTTIETITELKPQGVKINYAKALMQTTIEMVANILVSKRDYYGNMLDYLPWYEKKSIIFDELLKAYDREFKRAEQELDVVERNMFIDTAVELLNIYERDLGIRNNRNLIPSQRREQIAGRHRSIFDQTTEQSIKEVALAFGNGEIEIDTTDTEGLYEVKFIGKGIPNNLEGFKEVIDIIIPAHLGIIYVFTYAVWEGVKKLTWGDALALTWEGLKYYDGE